MLQLRVFGAPPAMAQVADCLHDIAGTRHVMRTEDGRSGQCLVTAELVDDVVDTALEQVKRLDIPAEDVALLRLDSISPVVARTPVNSVVWADLLSQAGANARPLARYLVFMTAAG